MKFQQPPTVNIDTYHQQEYRKNALWSSLESSNLKPFRSYLFVETISDFFISFLLKLAKFVSQLLIFVYK